MQKNLQRFLCGILLTIMLSGIIPDQFKANAAETYVPMLSEDRVWEYRSGYFGPPNSNEPTYFTMEVIGEVEINNCLYKVFSFTRSMVFSDYTREELLSDTIYEGTGTKFFLREADGIIYELYYGDVAYTTDERISDLNPPENGADGKYFSEKVLYNATLPNGAEVEVIIGQFYPNYSGVEIMRQFYGEKLEIGGGECRMIGWYRPETAGEEYPTVNNPAINGWIEGIGVIDNGILPLIGLYKVSSVPMKESGKPDLFEPKLTSVYTPDGTVLYGQTPVVAGINKVKQSVLSLVVNPNSLTVNGDGKLTVTIRCMDATTVMSASAMNEVVLSTDGLARGVYIVTAVDATSTRTLKIRL